jgi:replicative DNA helicase
MNREQLLERPLPNDAEAERAILGSIILDNAQIAGVVEMLEPRNLYVPAHRKIYEAMLELFGKGSAIDPILIQAELNRLGELESVGGIGFVSSLHFGLPRISNLSAYVERVRDTSQIRSLVRASNKIVSSALDAEEPAEVLIERAEAEIYSIRDNQQRSHMARISTLADSRIEAAQVRQASGKHITGLTTGYIELDSMLAGLQKANLIVVAARPSMGKTSICLNIGQNAAKEGAVVGVFSLEMSKEELTDRLLSSTASIDSHRLRTGHLNRDEWARLAQARGEVSGLSLFIDDTASLSIMQLRAKARRLASSQKRLDLIIVDYLQLMRSSKAESRFQEVSEIARALKSMAKEFDVPLLVLSQLSRAPEQRTDHRPMLSDLRESGEIEQAADVVAFIYREEHYNRTDENAGVAEVIIAKQRSGATGTVKLAFQKEFTRFGNMWEESNFRSYIQKEPTEFKY